MLFFFFYICYFSFYSLLCQLWWRISSLFSCLAVEGLPCSSFTENHRAIRRNEQQVLNRWDVYSISAMSHWSELLSTVTATGGFPPEPLLGLSGMFSFLIFFFLCSIFTPICQHRMSSQVPRHKCIINNRRRILFLIENTQNPPVLLINRSLPGALLWLTEICFDISFHKSAHFFIIYEFFFLKIVQRQQSIENYILWIFYNFISLWSGV